MMIMYADNKICYVVVPTFSQEVITHKKYAMRNWIHSHIFKVAYTLYFCFQHFVVRYDFQICLLQKFEQILTLLHLYLLF